LLPIAFLALVILASCSSDEVAQPAETTNLTADDVRAMSPAELEALVDSPDKCLWRPFSDYAEAQGTYCFDDGAGGCIDFEPPMLNFLGWTDPSTPYNALFEYLGNADPYLQEETDGEVDLNTRIRGRLVELPLWDGRGLLSVTVRVRNILAWVCEIEDYYLDPIVFGTRVSDVLEGAEPALADGRIQVIWIQPEYGMPVVDLFQLMLAPDEGYDMLYANIRLDAEGLFTELSGFPDGTPGRVEVRQVYMRPPDGDYDSGWPVESIEFFVD
jgi:hypothetical protein